MNAALDVLLKDFVSVEWGASLDLIESATGPHVYAIVVESEGHWFPLYVGQTQRLLLRIGDYRQGYFSAATDFRVGEAIVYLIQEKKCQVHFFYRQSTAHQADEKQLIRELLLAGFPLLNFLGGYDFRNANKDVERAFIHRFCDMVLRERWIAARPQIS